MMTQRSSETPLLELIPHFYSQSEVAHMSEITTGHIHRTFLVEFVNGYKAVFQRLSSEVFPDISVITTNIKAVLSHLAKYPPLGQEVLTPLSINGADLDFKDRDGASWRAYKFIEEATSYSLCLDQEMAHDAAYAFGNFQSALRSLHGGSLQEPIPFFMDCFRRALGLRHACDEDSKKRKSLISEEINYALDHEGTLRLITEESYSVHHQKKATHGDLKLNNLLFNTGTRKPVCVIDLDTCMEGSYLFDFGDMIRTGCSSSKEDESDLSLVHLDDNFFAAMAAGYGAAMGRHLTAFEREHLPESCFVLALTVGIRFLTDFLNGDKYFRITYPDQNLFRARAQFALAKHINRKLSHLKLILKKNF